MLDKEGYNLFFLMICELLHKGVSYCFLATPCS